MKRKKNITINIKLLPGNYIHLPVMCQLEKIRFINYFIKKEEKIPLKKTLGRVSKFRYLIFIKILNAFRRWNNYYLFQQPHRNGCSSHIGSFYKNHKSDHTPHWVCYCRVHNICYFLNYSSYRKTSIPIVSSLLSMGIHNKLQPFNMYILSYLPINVNTFLKKQDCFSIIVHL